MKNINPITDYPSNYDWLTEEQQNKILNLMTNNQKMVDAYWKLCKDSAENFEQTNLDDMTYIHTEMLDKTLNDKLAVYNIAANFLSGMRIAYASLGIMLEYNWPGHKNEWILATTEDAENYENAPEESDEEPINQNVLLSYGDVGI